MSFHFPTNINKYRLKDIRKSFKKSIKLSSESNTIHLNYNSVDTWSSNRGELENANRNSQAQHHHNLMMSLAFNDKLAENNKNLNLNKNTSHFQNQLSNTMMPSVKSRLIKNIGRTKEKILQGIGKTDRTSDESFDLYVDNFEQQHSQANKLNKELNKYLNCLKETQKSSKNFYDTLRETFETNWPMANNFSEQIDQLEHKWIDYLNKLYQDVQLPLMAYLNEFPELKKKIDKRCNRLLDYDNARHNLEHAQNKTLKKNMNVLSVSSINPNTNTSGGSSSSSSSTSHNSNHNSQTTTDQLTKLTKLKIDLEDKQHIYEEMNQTLCLALPVLYDNRIKFYSSLFQTFFHTETIFHSELVESKSKLDEICENLSIQTNSQISVQPENELNVIQSSDHINKNSDLPSIDDDYNENNHHDDDLNHNKTHENNFGESIDRKQTIIQNDNSKTITEFVPKQDSTENTHLNSSDDDLELNDKRLNKTSSNDNSKQTTNTSSIYTYLANQLTQFSPNDGWNEIQGLNRNENEYKFKYLYKVKATYPYEAKEIDELTFAKDDLIAVVEGSESEKEDLDEGWLIGVHESSSKRGLFPENFTKRI